jgi:hypothetical protein
MRATGPDTVGAVDLVTGAFEPAKCWSSIGPRIPSSRRDRSDDPGTSDGFTAIPITPALSDRTDEVIE